ncbi:MAG TPA: 2-oxo acid dehydrogenase subunit E2, partial [Alphaproteobacteria bacterium]|nr:2-oxo acid dehydrogenase subunit E2 [Alphaproteobacteria bacterium]
MNTKPSPETQKEIKVPPMGESITEATISRWLKKQGEAVTLDEPLAELETDKVTLEIGSPATGILTEVLVKQGETVDVGAVIGKVTVGATSSPEKEMFHVKHLPEKPVLQSSEEVPLSPAVRKLVAENKIDPHHIQGQGKDGRLTKGDVLTFLDKAKEKEAPQPVLSPAQPAPQRANEGRVERVRMSRLRQRIAERLKEAQNTAAILTTFNEVDMTNVIGLRTHLKEAFEKKNGVKLGFMSFFVKACLVGLKEFPEVNAEIDGDEIVYKNYYDIGIAVGTAQGLVVPVVRDADQKSFAQIEKDIATFGQRARDGKLALE